MNEDIIKCMNPYCNMEFKDTTKLKMQDSRNGRFINRCPYCLGVNTINTNENAVKRTKFIYIGKKQGERIPHKKMTKKIRKPNLDTEHISKKVLNYRQKCDISESSKFFAPGYERTQPCSQTSREDFVVKTGGTYNIAYTKPYTPQELMQQKINSRLEAMKSPPNNYKKYNNWWYRRQKE